MKNKLVKMMALLTATTMVAAGVMGCGSDSSDANADANTDTTASDTTANTDTTNRWSGSEWNRYTGRKYFHGEACKCHE